MDQKLFKYFEIANNGKYLDKWLFYELKKQILIQYGTADGHDKQVIPVICGRCKGNGQIVTEFRMRIPIKTEVCPVCNGEKRREDRVLYLHRYLLNEKVFHIPVNNYTGELKIKNTIKGKIKKPDVHPDNSYISMTVLALYFNPAFIEKLKEYGIMYASNYKRLKNEIEKEFDKIKNIQTKLVLQG